MACVTYINSTIPQLRSVRICDNSDMGSAMACHMGGDSKHAIS